jgi:hypothetical protein
VLSNEQLNPSCLMIQVSSVAAPLSRPSCGVHVADGKIKRLKCFRKRQGILTQIPYSSCAFSFFCKEILMSVCRGGYQRCLLRSCPSSDSCRESFADSELLADLVLLESSSLLYSGSSLALNTNSGRASALAL